MAKQFPRLTEAFRTFIARQHIFFVGTAAREGRVNVSPKGMDSLRVLDDNRLLWLNLTGSGNETAGHLRDTNRMTLMWCAFDGKPLILRVYGQARAIHDFDADWDWAYGHFSDVAGARQVFDLRIDLVQSSCGMGVPLMDFVEDRADDQLVAHFVALGPDGTQAYQERKNRQTIDGAPTGIRPDAG